MDSSISPSIMLGVNGRMTIRRDQKDKKPSSEGWVSKAFYSSSHKSLSGGPERSRRTVVEEHLDCHLANARCPLDDLGLY